MMRAMSHTADYQQAGTNTLAILALIFAFLFWPLGIVFGHMGYAQCRRTGEQGRGLALAGLIVSYLAFLALIVAVTALYALTLVRQ